MHAILTQKKPEYTAAIDRLHKELSALRTGRANPALVEDIPVEVYDSKMEIKGLASVQVPDSKTLVIEPWDKGTLQAIEKAIRDSGIGLSPVVDGQVIRIMIPQMTEENRVQIVKIVKDKVEDARIRVRGVREGLRDEVNGLEKAKEISEDEKFKLLDEIDKLTKEFDNEAGEIGKAKEEEIMTV